MATTALETLAESARALAAAGGEPAWLAEARLAACDAYEAAPLPDRVAHLWRYTEPEKFVLERVTPLIPAGAAPSMQLPADVAAAPAALVMVDGAVAHAAVAPEWHARGLRVQPLSEALREDEEAVRRWLGNAVGADAGKFEALNAGLFNAAMVVRVPRNLVVDSPIHLQQWAGSDRSALLPRLLLIMEEGAEAVIIDEYIAADPAARVLVNSVVEGSIQPNAHLTYFNIQRWGDRTRSHHRQRFLVQRDASITTVNIGLGGQYCKADLGNVQQGFNARSEMIGVVFGSGNQHFDTHTEHVHEVGNSASDMDFKVVLEDTARSVYTGLIRIDLEAANSEAYQENRNLMLDAACRAESIPELEILNENVRCTHGATVGPIDEDQVYYLRTRGLPRREAERLIVEGFFGPALDRIEDVDLRDRLWQAIDAKFDGGTR